MVVGIKNDGVQGIDWVVISNTPDAPKPPLTPRNAVYVL